MLIDSNIIIYALNKKSPFYDKARRFIYKDPYALVVAHQNIFECLRVLTHHTFPHPLTTRDAIKIISQTIEPFTIITPTISTAYIALQLIHQYSLAGNGIFDAYLAANMITNDIDTIATTNKKHFSVFKEIKVINPLK